MEPDPNKRGDLFTRRTADVLHVLGWENFRFDIAKAGRELDVTARHRAEKKTLRAECKAEVSPIGGAPINKFAGAIQVEKKVDDADVVAYFISLSGFTASARQQEDEADRGIVLLDSDDVIRELETANVVIPGDRAQVLAAEGQGLPAGARQEPQPYLIAHSQGWLWLVYSSIDHDRRYFTLLHADGTALTSALIQSVVRDDSEMYQLLSGLKNAPLPEEVVEDPTSALHRYLGFMRREYTSITLDGMPVDELVGTRAIPLEDLYVPLSVQPERVGLPPVLDVGLASEVRRKGELPRIPVERFLAQHRHVALVGPPGAGKSTIIKWLVTSALRDQFDSVGERLDRRSTVPVVLRCRTMRSPGETTIIEAIDDVIRQAELSHWERDFRAVVRVALNQGNLMLMIDGLDELSSDTNRAAFVSQVRTFLGTYPATRMVMTSRPTAFQRVASALSDICEVGRVADLSESEVQALCEKWERQVSDSYVPSSTAGEILSNHRVAALAVNPLLLTTMLLVKRWLGELPRKRSVLYDKALEVLAMTWNVEAHEPLDMDEVLPQLGYLAFEMTQAGAQAVEERELKRILTKARLEMPEILGYTTASVGSFLAAVEHRSSILSLNDHAVVDGVLEPLYEFKHLAFQEHLTARAVVEGWHPGHDEISDFSQTLAPHLGETGWQEVVPLAAILSGRSAASVVSALIQYLRSDGVKGADGEADYVARTSLAHCLADEVQISPQLAIEACATFLHGSEADDEDVVVPILKSKFRSIFLSVAIESAEAASGAGINGCFAWGQNAILEHGSRDRQWLVKPDGGIAYFHQHVSSVDLGERVAALTVAMDAGYHATDQDLRDVQNRKVDVDLDLIVPVAERVRELIVGGGLVATPERLAASWAFAWLGRFLDWDAVKYGEFVESQLKVWIEYRDKLEMVRIVAWSISALPVREDFLGKISLSADARDWLLSVVEHADADNRNPLFAALILLRYVGEDLDRFSDWPATWLDSLGIVWREWARRHWQFFAGEFAAAMRVAGEGNVPEISNNEE